MESSHWSNKNDRCYPQSQQQLSKNIWDWQFTVCKTAIVKLKMY